MEEQKGLRLYSFGNMYLQGIQAGIQCQHATTELFVKYLPFEHRCSDILYDWANNHKTTILLNGVMAKDLEELSNFLDKNSTLPWSYFNESEDALGGVLTNICIIVPERIYNADTFAPETTYTQYVIFCEKYNVTKLTAFEFELNKRIKSCRLIN